MRKRKFNVLPGERYGMLTIIKELEKSESNNSKYRIVRCKCDCGNIKDIRLISVVSGINRSCGCFLVQKVTNNNTSQKIANNIGRKNMVKELTKEEAKQYLFTDKELVFWDMNIEHNCKGVLVGMILFDGGEVRFKSTPNKSHEHCGIEIEPKMRPMTNFEVMQEVLNGAIVKSKDVNTIFNYWNDLCKPEDYYICYNPKEAKSYDELVWQECEVEQ